MDNNAMTADEAIEAAREQLDDESGDPALLIDHGLDIMEALLAEIERLRAIIDGRTTAPTEEETVALFASGGQWMVTWDDGTLGKITTVPYWHHMAPKVQRWIPVLDGRPTTWPVVTP